MAFPLSQAPIRYSHTGTTNDTLIWAGSGYLCSITVTKTNGEAFTIYDTAVATGAASMAAETVLVPAVTLAGTEVHPIHWNFSNPIRFQNGLGIDLGTGTAVVMLVYSRDKAA